jgi:hypothetical protein
MPTAIELFFRPDSRYRATISQLGLSQTSCFGNAAPVTHPLFMQMKSFARELETMCEMQLWQLKELFPMISAI